MVTAGCGCGREEGQGAERTASAGSLTSSRVWKPLRREFLRSSVGQNDTEQLKPFKKCGGVTQRSLDDSRRRVSGIW